MRTTPLRVLLFLAAASAIGCEAVQRASNGSGGSTATGPSPLKRVVDDVGAASTGGGGTTGGCATPPCTPPPPEPQPVDGSFVVTSADGSTIAFPYSTITTPSGVPAQETGNVDFDTTKVNGSGRFAGIATAIFSVVFGSGSTATISLKWSIAQQGIPDGYRSYGDTVTFPYSSRKGADSNCASGSRFTAEIPGRMENIGRFTATINHCVSPIQ